LKPDRVSMVPALNPPPAAPERVPGVPAQVAHAVSRNRDAQLCWVTAGLPVLAGAAWALDWPDVLAWLPAHVPRPARSGAPAALVIEHHQGFRATRVMGLCLRGRLELEPVARAAVAQRYGGVLPEDGTALRLHTARLTWWRGFEVHSGTLAESVAGAVMPEARAR